MSKRTWWYIAAAVAAVVLIVAGVAVAQSRAGGQGVSLFGLKLGGSQGAAGSVDAVSSRTKPGGGPQGGSAGAAGNGTNSGGGGTGGTSGGGTPGTTGGTPGTSGGKKPVVDGKNIMLIFYDDTKARPLKSISIGTSETGLWSPEPGAQGQKKVIGPLPVGTAVDLLVYTNGRSARPVGVTLILSKDMASGTQSFGVNVAVSDTSVRFVGVPVSNMDRSVPRP